MDYLDERPRRTFPIGLLVGLFLLLLFLSRSLARFFLDYEWWKEIGQISTWTAQLTYGLLPVILSAVVTFAVLFVTHARALKHAGTGLRQQPSYARITTVILLVLSFILASALVDTWTIVRYVGGRGLAAGPEAWTDPVFGRPLGFYFFELPFYRTLLRLLSGIAVVAAILYWIASRLWTLRRRLPSWGSAEGVTFDIRDLDLRGALESKVFRVLTALFFLSLAFSFLLDRYELLFEDHGSLVGIDWVAETVTLPLLWISMGACILAAAGMLAGRWSVALLVPLTLIVNAVVPGILAAVYVRPSEITIQKPYIQRHIEATRSAYGLTTRLTEKDFPARMDAPIDLQKHKALLDNVRLWDWRAFHDTVTQIQALRPYYVFRDSDVDRYQIDGQLRQVLLTPRELDVNQLPADARSRWINPHFVYTHGYGLVVAEAARITREGLPVLLVQDAPPEVKTPALKLNRPELYYGEVTHEPVFVRTKQAEFDYPSGSGNVETRYDGKGGFPISSAFSRTAAALATGDWNILLTSYLAPESRMMIRRQISDRLSEVAGFVTWDPDPYLVITTAGRLVWMVDGYTTSSSHPYSKIVSVSGPGRVNYIRNSVKATVDAYDGAMILYSFDAKDPILQAYRRLFPQLVREQSEMPADLRAHARYPELIFRVQAEIYRTFHMRNPEAFFNKEDMWDLARNQSGAANKAEVSTPTYIVATLPDRTEPEFLLMLSFTPRNKDNLIGLLVGRCDGEHLGELVSLQLSKQELIYGPMQIEAIINQDQNISKDLSLWNQQGSQVLRGQMLVLPVENTLLYIEPIYIQASEARMPQLKKVAIALGQRLIYADTYEKALAELGGSSGPASPEASTATSSSEVGTTPSTPPGNVVEEIRRHLQRYRSLLGQGRYAEAGKEMEEVDRLLEKKR